MSDLLLAWDGTGRLLDLRVAAPDLAIDGDGLQTAVIVSLFTDRRVEPEELPPGESDRRGWWGDVLNRDAGALRGSRLWLLRREKRTPEVLQRARAYAEEALAWLVDVGAAGAVHVAAAWLGELLALGITIDLRDGTSREWQFQDVLRAA